MYIQEEQPEKERNAPPDYSGHTYKAPERIEPFSQEETEIEVPQAEAVSKMQDASLGESTPAGAFGARGGAEKHKGGGKRGELFGNLGLSGLFSRVPFLSSLAPPPRRCDGEERKHSELWDWVLLAVVALSFLNGRDDDVLPILLLLLLWD